MPKRRDRRRTGSTPSTTRCTDGTSWSSPTCLRSHDGAPGVDGQTFEDIEAYGRDRWLDELTTELRERTYRPFPVRRGFIPKGDGKQRPLGIGSIRDRVVQMAVVLVWEPIFEADLPPEQHAYRPDHNALDAIRQVHGYVRPASASLTLFPPAHRSLPVAPARQCIVDSVAEYLTP